MSTNTTANNNNNSIIENVVSIKYEINISISGINALIF